MEGAQAEAACADVGVEVAAGVERGLGVVDVEGAQVGEADGGVEFGEGGGEGGGRAEVIACGKDVAGVKADADAVLFVDEGDDGGEFFEGAADGVAVEDGHGFEEGDDGAGGGVFVGLVELGGELLERFLTGGAGGVAGMEVVELDAELVAAGEVVGEGIVGLLCSCGVGVRQIHQVGSVWNNVLGAVVLVMIAL